MERLQSKLGGLGLIHVANAMLASATRHDPRLYSDKWPEVLGEQRKADIEEDQQQMSDYYGSETAKQTERQNNEEFSNFRRGQRRA